jgi:hypothetical protein
VRTEGVSVRVLAAHVGDRLRPPCSRPRDGPAQRRSPVSRCAASAAAGRVATFWATGQQSIDTHLGERENTTNGWPGLADGSGDRDEPPLWSRARGRWVPLDHRRAQPAAAAGSPSRSGRRSLARASLRLARIGCVRGDRRSRRRDPVRAGTGRDSHGTFDAARHARCRAGWSDGDQEQPPATCRGFPPQQKQAWPSSSVTALLDGPTPPMSTVRGSAGERVAAWDTPSDHYAC